MESNLVSYIEHPEQLNAETLGALRSCVDRFPYFQVARLLYLQNLCQLRSSDFGKELTQWAPLVPDREKLFHSVEGIKYEMKPPQRRRTMEVGNDRTETLINRFLEETPEERPTKRALTVHDATTDYATYLLQMDDAETDEPVTEKAQRSSLLIDDFIGNNNGQIVLSPASDPAPEELAPDEGPALENDEDYFTETLAKIYIQQGKYAKAIEIIRKLNLNYPKKNRYFADQIRFLRKLELNERNKNN